MTDITFITGNQNKADFLAKHLGMPVAHHKLDLDEIQSLDLHEVVEHKVRQAYGILKTPVLVEDASLSFAAMGRLPGTFIKWFIEEIGYDGLLKLASSLPDQTAHGNVCYGYYDGKELRLFDGEMHGRIAKEVQNGPLGFGFDPIFINDGYDKTRALMTEDEYDATSYRMDGIKKLREFLTPKQK
ncbi:MAG TPA: non-canonical purine NTP pyrophosphatase [Candidatus Saccharimonadales bacterium]|nr:non-canonical purine NTP pyrophosphatase [Candidatus Saccharimonadales bacterium]